MAPYGQLTVIDSPTGSQSGVFYLTDTGGGKYADDCILAIAVNGTVSDDFQLHIRTSGYNWIPAPGEEEPPQASAIRYVDGAVNETFYKSDFIYGPQNWRPSGEITPYPLYSGQDMSDMTNTYRLMFVDTKVGTINLYGPLTDSGATKVEYTISGLNGYVAFNSYEYLNHSKPGNGVTAISWTNRDGSSGYLVKGTYAGQPPVAAFTSDVQSAPPARVQFTDASSEPPLGRDFENDGTIDDAEQNQPHLHGGRHLHREPHGHERRRQRCG